MLAVARGVLMRVHHGVFEALAAPPVRAPDGTLVYGNWDVRHVLRQARRQVRGAAMRATCTEHAFARSDASSCYAAAFAAASSHTLARLTSYCESSPSLHPPAIAYCWHPV